jgi:cytoskeleton-associated protein 5
LLNLQVLVKDSNVVCVAEAAACFGALAKGLRKDFSGIAKAHFGTILDKLKDKNTNVCTQSAQACITFHK